MKYNFLNHFTVIEPCISPALMDKTSVDSVKKLCALFPFDIADDFGFESRLGNQEAICDFVMQIRKGSKGAVILAGQSAIASLAGPLTEDPFWKKIAHLFAAWNNTDHLLYKMVTDFWLEFDWQGTSYNLIPNIFFDLQKESQADRLKQWQLIHQVLDEIYTLLFDIQFPADMAVIVKSCITKLPKNARLRWIGFMVPRKTEAVRMVFSQPDQETLFSYLREIEWPGEEDIVRNQIKPYADKFNSILYNINIGRQVLPYLGLELFSAELRRPVCSPLLIEMLDFLSSQSLLLDTKREGLMHFCGLKTISYFYPVQYLSGINHFKYVYAKNKAPELKGYFGTIIKNKID